MLTSGKSTSTRQRARRRLLSFALRRACPGLLPSLDETNPCLRRLREGCLLLSDYGRKYGLFRSEKGRSEKTRLARCGGMSSLPRAESRAAFLPRGRAADRDHRAADFGRCRVKLRFWPSAFLLARDPWGTMASVGGGIRRGLRAMGCEVLRPLFHVAGVSVFRSAERWSLCHGGREIRAGADTGLAD